MASHLLGLDGRDANMLRLARMAGWVAHAVEQYDQQFAIRQATRYKGQLPD